MKRWHFGVSFCALALAACGGGGGSSSPPATAGGGTATPAPAPAPTPPPITYTAFDDLTGDQTFMTACAAGASTEFTVDANAFSATGFVTIDRSASGDTFTVSGGTRAGEVNTTFRPEDIVQDEPGVLTLFQRPTTANGLTEVLAFGTPQWPTTTAQYVRGAFFLALSETGIPVGQNCIFGVPTELNDELPTSTITYTMEIDAAGSAVTATSTAGPIQKAFNLAPTTFTISADPTTGVVSYTIDLKGFEQSAGPDGLPVDSTEVTEFGTYTGSANVGGAAGEEAQFFAGDLLKEGAIGLNAQTSGWFFGPQGIEVGVVVSGTEQLVDGSFISFSFGITAQQDP